MYRSKTKACHSAPQRKTKHTVHRRHPIISFRISNLGFPSRFINMQSVIFLRASLVQLSLVYSEDVWKFAPWVTYSHLIVVTCRKEWWRQSSYRRWLGNGCLKCLDRAGRCIIAWAVKCTVAPRVSKCLFHGIASSMLWLSSQVEILQSLFQACVWNWLQNM